MSDFMWFEDEVNPVEKAQKTAKAVEAVRNELTDRGIFAFVMNADSLPEAEQRLAMREVNAAIDDVVVRYLPEDEGAKARLVSSIFKQFEAKDNHKHVTETCLTCEGTGTSDYGIRCKSCNGRGEVSNEVRSNKLAADDDMPMKDGKPAFLDDEDSDSDEDDDDSDDDDDDDDDKKKKRKSDEDEDEEDEDDEDDDKDKKDS